MIDIPLNPLGEPDRHRLNPATRDLAKRYLTGVYQARLQDCGFSLGELNLPADTPPETVHAKATLLNAEKCRLDILPEELPAGSEPNIESTWRRIPGVSSADPQNGTRRSGRARSLAFPDPFPRRSPAHTDSAYGNGIRRADRRATARHRSE